MTNEILLKFHAADYTLGISGSSSGVEGAAFPVVELSVIIATNTIVTSIKE